MKTTVSDRHGGDDFPKISQPALRALHGAGHHTLRDLTTVRQADLGQLHGMGPKALGILRDALAERGLGFAEAGWPGRSSAGRALAAFLSKRVGRDGVSPPHQPAISHYTGQPTGEPVGPRNGFAAGRAG